MGISHLPLAYEYMCTQAHPCKGTQTIHTLTEHRHRHQAQTSLSQRHWWEGSKKAPPQQGEWLLGNVRAESVFLNNFTQNTCSAPSRAVEGGRMPDPPQFLFQQPTLQEKLLHRSTPPLWLAKLLGALINPDKPPWRGKGKWGSRLSLLWAPLRIRAVSSPKQHQFAPTQTAALGPQLH